MNALNGISTLQTALGTLNVGESAPASATQNKTGATTGTQSSAAAQAGTTDRTSLSAAGGLAAQGADNSDVRLGKVSELRQAINSGTYNVSASAVADKIVEGLLSGL